MRRPSESEDYSECNCDQALMYLAIVKEMANRWYKGSGLGTRQEKNVFRMADDLVCRFEEDYPTVNLRSIFQTLEEPCDADVDQPKPTGIVTRAFYEGAVNTLKEFAARETERANRNGRYAERIECKLMTIQDELRAAHDDTGRLTNEVEELRLLNQNMADKLAHRNS